MSRREAGPPAAAFSNGLFPPHEAGMRLVARPHRPRTCPTLSLKLSNAKYRSWKQFIDHAYWDVELT